MKNFKDILNEKDIDFKKMDSTLYSEFRDAYYKSIEGVAGMKTIISNYKDFAQMQTEFNSILKAFVKFDSKYKLGKTL